MGLDPDAVEGAAKQCPMTLPNMLVDYVRDEPPGLTTGWWRGVGPTHNIFVVESFIDELAAATKKDPVEFRRSMLGKQPRVLGVLNLAAEKAGWGTPLPEGVGRGVSVQFAMGSYLSQIAEVEVSKEGEVKVRRVVCAVDCGQMVNPDTIMAQIEGRHHLRHQRRAVGRDHAQERPRRAAQFQRLSRACASTKRR